MFNLTKEITSSIKTYRECPRMREIFKELKENYKEPTILGTFECAAFSLIPYTFVFVFFIYIAIVFDCCFKITIKSKRNKELFFKRF